MSPAILERPVTLRRGYSPQWTPIVPVGTPWQLEALKNLLQVARLPHDWDSYGSPPPPPRVVDACISLFTAIEFDDLPVPRIVPIPGGGIQMEWTAGEKELELSVLPEGRIEFLELEGGDSIEEGNVEFRGQLYSLLEWVMH